MDSGCDGKAVDLSFEFDPDDIKFGGSWVLEPEKRAESLQCRFY
jgi:hypothetical protein